MFFCCIPPPHLEILKILSDIKLVCGANKVGDRWRKTISTLISHWGGGDHLYRYIFGLDLLNKTSLWLKYQRSKKTIEMSAPWVFYHCVNQYNNRPPMGGTVWEESSLTDEPEDNKGTSGRRRACLPPLWCRCCCPGRRWCRSQARMRTPFGFLTPEAFFFFFLTGISRKYRVFLRWVFPLSFFFIHMCD